MRKLRKHDFEILNRKRKSENLTLTNKMPFEKGHTFSKSKTNLPAQLSPGVFDKVEVDKKHIESLLNRIDGLCTESSPKTGDRFLTWIRVSLLRDLIQPVVDDINKSDYKFLKELEIVERDPEMYVLVA